MSKQNDRDREDADLKARLDALDARMEAQRAEHRSQLAQIRLEREARELQAYAAQRIAIASAGGDISPAFVRMLREGQYTSYAAIDAAIRMAREGTAEMCAAQAPPSPPAEQPRDERGRWLPEQPAEQVPAGIDLSKLTLAEYTALRGSLGIADRSAENVSNRPGHTQASGEGMFDGLPGYRDPRQANQRVFESQLPDNRRTVPPGYLRRDAGQNDEWR